MRRNPRSAARAPSGLSDVQLDRAAGVLLGAACGDALGVPYEFARPLTERQNPEMAGGGLGPYAPGEYSDDTQMAACIARVAATGTDLRSEQALDAIAAAFMHWQRNGASDIGAQTSHVLAASARSRGSAPAAAMRRAAGVLHAETGRSAGNGSLMRTGIVALAYLNAPRAMAGAARAISELTHADLLAGDACVIWCEMIRRTVLKGDLPGVGDVVGLIPVARRGQWHSWLEEARHHPPRRFSPNGYVVTAIQAAWSAITRTPVPDEDPPAGSFACQHLQNALAAAIRAGDDTDTVAAIAGALLGARWGASAIPYTWMRLVHGWPGLHATDLVRLAALTAWSGGCDRTGWPAARHIAPPVGYRARTVPHPSDDGVLLGSLATRDITADAVVSLCRTGTQDFTGISPADHIQLWLVDTPGHNSHTAYVIDQAARAIAHLRSESKIVLLHCAAGRSRTPAVAARYATLTAGIPPAKALARVEAALADPCCTTNQEFRRVLSDLGHGS